MPPLAICITASSSGIKGLMQHAFIYHYHNIWLALHSPNYLSKILAMRCSPLPFFSITLVVEAWASTWPPTGLITGPNMDKAPGSAMHWLITTTAILNSSAMRTRWERCWPSFCWRSDSSPRPENSTRNSASSRSSFWFVWRSNVKNSSIYLWYYQ